MGLQETQEDGGEMVCFSKGESGRQGLTVVAIAASEAVVGEAVSYYSFFIYKYLTPCVSNHSICLFSNRFLYFSGSSLGLWVVKLPNSTQKLEIQCPLNSSIDNLAHHIRVIAVL